MEQESKYLLIYLYIFYDFYSKKASFKDSLKKVCQIWRKDPTSDKVLDALYLLTAKEFELLFY